MGEPLSEQTSIYLQISKMLEDNILRDIYLEEEQVPSTNELARIYNINPATAAKGINILVDANILYKKRGIGMFVAQGGKKVIKEKRKNAFAENYIKLLISEAKSLDIGKDELLHMIEAAIIK